MNIKNFSSNISKKQILLLSIPVFFSNLAIPLVGIVDTGLMGNLGESKYLAATSIATSVMTMIVWSFAFLRMGTVGIVSQLYAKSDYREIARTLIRNFLIAIVISTILIIFKFLIIDLIENFFKVSAETNKLIDKYISIRILSVPAEFTIYILIGFFLGIQQTKISSLFVILFSALNIVLSSLFVLSLNLNISGVALGTLISSYLTSIIFLYYTYKFIISRFQIIPSFNKLLSPSKVFKLVSINFNIFIRSLLLTFAFLWVPFLGSKLGEDILAINIILMQFIIFASFFLDAYAFSTEGIVGYSIGKRSQKSFIIAVTNSIQLSFFTAILISITYIIFFKDIINIITNVEILRFMSYKHAIWIIIIPPIAAFCYQLDGIYTGASQTKEMRNAMMISVSLFIVLSFYLTKFLGNHGLWLSLLIFMSLRSLTLLIFFNRIVKRI